MEVGVGVFVIVGVGVVAEVGSIVGGCKICIWSIVKLVQPPIRLCRCSVENGTYMAGGCPKLMVLGLS